MCFPVQDAADWVAAVNAVPKTSDMLRVPDERPLERRDQELSFRQRADKRRYVDILYIYFMVEVTQIDAFMNE